MQYYDDIIRLYSVVYVQTDWKIWTKRIDSVKRVALPTSSVRGSSTQLTANDVRLSFCNRLYEVTDIPTMTIENDTCLLVGSEFRPLLKQLFSVLFFSTKLEVTGRSNSLIEQHQNYLS